jgi:hypothetical protein
MPPTFLGLRGYWNVSGFVVAAMGLAIIAGVIRRQGLKLGEFLIGKPLALFLLYIAFSIIYPTLRRDTTLFLAVRQGRDNLLYIVYFYIVSYVSEEDQARKIMRFLILVAFCSTAIAVVQPVLGHSRKVVPYYDIASADFESFSMVKVYTRTFALSFFAFFYLLWRGILSRKVLGYVVPSCLLLAGGVLEHHRAMVIGAFASFPVMLCLVPQWGRGQVLKAFALAIACVVILSIFFAVLLLDSPAKSLEIVDSFGLSGVREFLSKSGAYAARVRVNEKRWVYFKRHPFLGNGAIDPESKLGKEFGSGMSHYARELSTVDSGFLDILIQFGIIGASVLVYVIYRMFRIIICALRELSVAQASLPVDDYRRAFALALLNFLLMLLISLPTLSTLTWAGSIVPLMIGFGLLDVLIRNTRESEGCNGNPYKGSDRWCDTAALPRRHYNDREYPALESV